METIYTVTREALRAYADAIEKSATASLNAWILCGMSGRYCEEMAKARALRTAASERYPSIRREILRNSGFDVRMPRDAGKQ